MKTKLCKINIDEYERGAIITALMELRNKYISEEKSNERDNVQKIIEQH